jgi:adenylate kinase
MRMVLVGAPGCGKGTHSAWMVTEIGIPQISTGDILREAVAKDTPLGRQANAFMDSGALVPDALILDLMRERLAQPDAARGFILDGFPRTIPQAEGLDRLLSERHEKLDRVIKIDVDREELVRRLTSRRVCPQCNAVYNLSFRPPKVADVCDTCGGKVVQREDDKEATVLKRLKVYETQTAPLMRYYAQRNLLGTADGNQGYAETRAQIEKLLGSRTGS